MRKFWIALWVVAASVLVYCMMYVFPMPPCFLAGPTTPGCYRAHR